VFHYRDLAALSSNDQVARMVHDRRATGYSDKKHVNGRFDDHTFWNRNANTVFNERGIKRGKRIALAIQITAKVLLNTVGIALQLRGQASDLDSCGHCCQSGQIRGKQTVDKHQTRSKLRYAKWLQLFPRNALKASQFKDRLAHCGDIRETPVFVMRGRKAGFGETGKRLLPQRLQPVRLGSRAGAELLEDFLIFSWSLGCSNHNK